MKHYCFKHFRKFVLSIFEDESQKDNNERWRFQGGVDEFNNLRVGRIGLGSWMIVDETMSAWWPRISATGKLPNISYIF